MASMLRRNSVARGLQALPSRRNEATRLLTVRRRLAASSRRRLRARTVSSFHDLGVARDARFDHGPIFE
jgi:hypothetical protein